MRINLDRIADAVCNMEERQEIDGKTTQLIHILVGIYLYIFGYLNFKLCFSLYNSFGESFSNTQWRQTPSILTSMSHLSV